MSVEIEYDGEVYEFEDTEDLQNALSGEFGDEYQVAAEALATELDGGEDGTAAQAFEAEVRHLEGRIGRTLTKAEIDRLVNSMPQDGTMPNLADQYGDELATRATKDGDSRRALMLERAEDAGEAAEAEDAESNAHLTPAGNRIANQDADAA